MESSSIAKQVQEIQSFFSVIEEDTDLFIDPEYQKDVAERVKWMSQLIKEQYSNSQVRQMGLKVMNTLKKVFRIEQKKAQDAQCVKDCNLMRILIGQGQDDIFWTKQVVSLFVNYITANLTNQVTCLNLLVERTKTLEFAIRDMECLYYILVFLYNSLCNQPSDFVQDFLTKHSKTLLLPIFTLVLNLPDSELDSKYFSHVHEWFSRLLTFLLKKQPLIFRTLFSKLGNSLDNDSILSVYEVSEDKVIKNVVNGDQRKILVYIKEVIEEMLEDKESHGKEMQAISESQVLNEILVKEVFQGLCDSYKEHFLLEEFLRMMHNVNPLENEDKQLIQIHENLLDSLEALLSIFIDLTANSSVDDNQQSPLTITLNQYGLLLYTMQFFQTLKTSQDTMKEVKSYFSDTPSKMATNPSLLFSGFLSKLANLVSNLTYLQGVSIDSVFLANPSFLGVILAHTRMDEHNPTMREWCLMIIRNMCQSSEGVKQILQNMKKVGSENENDEEIIKQIGLEKEAQRQQNKYV